MYYSYDTWGRALICNYVFILFCRELGMYIICRSISQCTISCICFIFMHVVNLIYKLRELLIISQCISFSLGIISRLSASFRAVRLIICIMYRALVCIFRARHVSLWFLTEVTLKIFAGRRLARWSRRCSGAVPPAGKASGELSLGRGGGRAAGRVGEEGERGGGGGGEGEWRAPKKHKKKKQSKASFSPHVEIYKFFMGSEEKKKGGKTGIASLFLRFLARPFLACGIRDNFSRKFFFTYIFFVVYDLNVNR